MCLLESGEQVHVATVWARLEKVAAREQISRYVDNVGDLIPNVSGLEGAMRQQVARPYRTVAPFLGLLATAVPLGATKARQPVLDALAGVVDLRSRRQLRSEDGHQVLDTDIARLSPLGDQHINMLFRYAFTTPAPTVLRPLRPAQT